MAQRRLPSLNALQAFEAAGRLGRMTLAAEELCVTHGAISRHVRYLEEVLGARLFEGPKNRLQLTDAGRILVADLTPAFGRIEAGVRAVADEDTGTLDVSCLSTMLLRWLIPRLHRFNTAFPSIQVRLSASHAPVDFNRERYDIAIRMQASGRPAPKGAIAVSLFQDDIGPVLSPALSERLTVRGLQDLERVPLLHSRTRPEAWAAWSRDVGWSVSDLQGMEFEHFYVMLEGAIAGLGMCIAPWPYVIDDLRAGRLCAPFGFRASGNTYVAMRPGRRSRKAEAFCAWLMTEAESTAKPGVTPVAGRAGSDRFGGRGGRAGGDHTVAAAGFAGCDDDRELRTNVGE